MNTITQQRESQAQKLIAMYHAIQDGSYDQLYSPEQRGELLFLISMTIRTLRGESAMPETSAMVAHLLALGHQD